MSPNVDTFLFASPFGRTYVRQPGPGAKRRQVREGRERQHNALRQNAEAAAARYHHWTKEARNDRRAMRRAMFDADVAHMVQGAAA